MTKICNQCNIEKELTEFGISKFGKYGRRARCKDCMNKNDRDKTKTKDGLITLIYKNQRNHSKTRNMNHPTYTKQELKEWLVSQKLFEDLYDEWVVSGYNINKVPSVDRIDDYISYTLDNIQLMTWEENRSKAHSDVKNGINKKYYKPVKATNCVTNETYIFDSITHAEQQLNINHSLISAVCKGKRKKTGGYYWEYI